MTAFIEDADEREIRHKMQVAALNEEIDRLLAALRVEQEKARKAEALKEQVHRLSAALDDALAIVRARNEIARQEREAGL